MTNPTEAHQTRDSVPDGGVPGHEEYPLLREKLAPWWAGPLFLFLAIALVPWSVYLAATLPAHTVASHYRTAWVGFDILLAAALARTAWLALKGKREMEFPAVVTATLLLVDAWFDIMTSKSGASQMEAIFLAFAVELPTAFLALYLSRRVDRVVHGGLQHLVIHGNHARSRRRAAQPSAPVGTCTEDEATA